MIFELLFLFLLVASLIALMNALVVMVRGGRRAAKRLLQGLGTGWAIYVLVVVFVSATTPERILPMGQDLCFDEMCFAVAQAEVVPQLEQDNSIVKARGRFYVVTVRMTSRSRGRAQSEGGLHALLWNSGKYYEVSPQGQRAWETTNSETSKLTTRLNPGQSALSVQVFDVPQDAVAPGLVLSHGFTPGYFVIGECPLFHKPTMLRLSP